MAAAVSAAPSRSILSEYTNQLYMLLDMLVSENMFPECEKLAQVMDMFKTTVLPSPEMQRVLCVGWHTQMGLYYDACTARNPQPFMEGNIALLEKIEFRQKYEELTDATEYTPEEIESNIGNLWRYINNVNQFARLYNHIPPALAARMENAASELIGELSSGKDLRQVNWIGVGEKVLAHATKKDVFDLMGSMEALVNTTGDVGNVLGGVAQLEPFLKMMKLMGNGQSPDDAAFAVGMTVEDLEALRSSGGGVAEDQDSEQALRARAASEWLAD